MNSVICRGVNVAPGPYCRLPQMNDGKSQQMFGLRYVKLAPRCFKVFRFIPGQKYDSCVDGCIGRVVGSFGHRMWVYFPNTSTNCYIAPTRFEAISACHGFYSFMQQ